MLKSSFVRVQIFLTLALVVACVGHEDRATRFDRDATGRIELCLAAAGLAPAQAQTALDDVMAKKLITIAIPTDFPPYGFVGTDLKPQGLDIDMGNYIAAKLGVKVELVPVTSANRIPYLQTKKVDLVISSLGKNPEREKTIDFSIAYAPFFLAVFGPQDAKITSADALAGTWLTDEGDSKVEIVPSARRHPFYQWVADELPPGALPRWNVHKYLIGKDGTLKGVFGSRTEPKASELQVAIDAALGA